MKSNDDSHPLFVFQVLAVMSADSALNALAAATALLPDASQHR